MSVKITRMAPQTTATAPLLLYAVIGVAVLWLSFTVIDKITPYKLWDELCEKKNVALAIVVGAMFIAIGQIAELKEIRATAKWTSGSMFD